jgi:hypothetical protein
VGDHRGIPDVVRFCLYSAFFWTGRRTRRRRDMPATSHERIPYQDSNFEDYNPGRHPSSLVDGLSKSDLMTHVFAPSDGFRLGPELQQLSDTAQHCFIVVAEPLKLDEIRVTAINWNDEARRPLPRPAVCGRLLVHQDDRGSSHRQLSVYLGYSCQRSANTGTKNGNPRTKQRTMIAVPERRVS